MIYKLILLFVVALLILSCTDEELPYQESYLCSYDLDSNNIDYIISESGGIAKFNFDGSRIIVSDNYGFWVIQSDGTNIQTFTDSLTARKNTFATSPISNDWIFIDNGEVYKMNLDNELLCLTDEIEDSAMYSSYSIDGSTIVFSTILDSSGIYQSKIYLMNSDGSLKDLIYSINQNDEWIKYPVVSEDMEKIFFMTSKSRIYMFSINDANLDLIIDNVSIANALTTSANLLVYVNSSQEIIAYDFVSNDFTEISYGENPSISPDGTKITYYKNSDLYIYYIDENDEDKIADSSDYYQFFSHNSDKIVYWGKKGSRTKGITSLGHKVRDEY